MIHVIPHAVSDGLRKENEVHSRSAHKHTPGHFQSSFPTPRAFLQRYVRSAEGLQFTQAMGELTPGSRVLDIGAGIGRTSVYLASQGHRVAAVEPSPDRCRAIETAARLYGLPVTIYNVPAEYLDRLPVKDFDACVFNASLHHCDEPDRALRNCHALLAPGGRVFLLNEPLLPFYRSKAWFRRQVERGTLVTGHYGGNEHSYYRHEYIALLRAAGFGQVRERLSTRYFKPDDYLRKLEGRKVARRRVLPREIYYGLVRMLGRSGLIGGPALGVLKKLSLVQTYFIATRRSAVRAAPGGAVIRRAG